MSWTLFGGGSFGISEWLHAFSVQRLEFCFGGGFVSNEGSVSSAVLHFYGWVFVCVAGDASFVLWPSAKYDLQYLGG